ncbi:helix-turn-helix domain-containing protein [Sphingomonas ginsenosidivorax]|uniref:TetR/AcrR family transcriptional regulator n=1 Tax=Sphingomonas ginsenosidivorax TaxID=862135 RepID=UPI0030CAF4EA
MQHDLCSRDRIVATARHLFSTQGFHKTAMSELAQSADVSVGQIYRLFTGKDAIIQAIVLEDAAAKELELSKICEDATAGRITIEVAFVELARRALSKGDEALSFEIMAEAHRNPGVADSIGGLCQGFRDVISELACVANPDLTATQLEGAEELVLAFMFGLGHRTLSRPQLSEDETARLTGRMMVAAVRAL